MRAVIVDRSRTVGVVHGDVVDPVADSHQALVRIRAFSVVSRNLRHARSLPPGSVPGFDAAGVVLRPAEDGSGPPAGAEVVTVQTGGAWAELRAISTDELAIVPSGVELGRASASAIPAVSALRALRRFGALLGERVLVIGASGAVGWFAIQLGRLAGAEITACVRSLERGAGLRELGATDVVTDLAHVKGRFRGVIDNVGGSQLVQAFQLLNEGGSVQTLGSMSAEPAVFPPYSTLGPRRAIESFWAGSQMSADLGYVLGLAAAGRLELTDGPCHDWTYFERVATQLAESPRAARAIMSVHRN